jgi:hypothetical protein
MAVWGVGLTSSLTTERENEIKNKYFEANINLFLTGTFNVFCNIL